MTEAIIKAIEAFTESNRALLAFLKERDAGWTKLHNMEAEVREINFASEIAVNKKRAELLATIGERAVLACAIHDNRYGVRELLEKAATK